MHPSSRRSPTCDYHLDYETFSPEDIKKTGEHRYASHPKAEILMLSIGYGAEGPYLWINPRHDTVGRSDPRAWKLMQRMVADKVGKIYAHRVGFETAVTRWMWERDTGLPAPHLQRFRCTAALCRRAGLPSALADAAATLGLKQQKDTTGKKLINIFCKLQPKTGVRIMPEHRPEEFRQFGEYCLQDLRAEKELHEKLRYFELSGPLEQAFEFDLRMNDEGIPVNHDALLKAKTIIDQAMEDVGAKFTRLTGLNPSQNAKCKAWFAGKGLKLPNLQADTIEEALTKPVSPAALPALKLYAQVQFSAVKKVQTMINVVCRDSRLRGMFLFYGAGTGRWSGQVVQPQNFKRPTVKSTDLAYAMICRGCTREDLDIIWGNSLDVISSCIRNFMQWMRGIMFDADYAAIEARIVCWLSDQQDTLEEFRKGVDSYKAMAAHIYGCSIDDIANPSERREVGKRAVLGCGFNMGAPKFRSSCRDQYGLDISEELAELAVDGYRTKNFKVAAMWKTIDTAARNAIARPGQRFKAGKLLSFVVEKHGGVPYLLMRLPSGRELAYPHPAVEEYHDTRFERTKVQVTFFGHIKGKQWGRVPTYGGKLLENATQAVAADIMSNGAVNATREGFRIFALIHDQALALKLPGQKLTDYVRCLTTLPDWAAGLPIKADAKEVPYYKKG
jgi:DNA polymerase